MFLLFSPLKRQQHHFSLSPGRLSGSVWALPQEECNPVALWTLPSASAHTPQDPVVGWEPLLWSGPQPVPPHRAALLASAAEARQPRWGYFSFNCLDKSLHPSVEDPLHDCCLPCLQLWPRKRLHRPWRRVKRSPLCQIVSRNKLPRMESKMQKLRMTLWITTWKRQSKFCWRTLAVIYNKNNNNRTVVLCSFYFDIAKYERSWAWSPSPERSSHLCRLHQPESTDLLWGRYCPTSPTVLL